MGRTAARVRAGMVLALVLGWDAVAFGQTNGTPSAVREPRPVARAERIAVAPVVDGLLNEDVWRQASPITGFTQAEPFEGQPVSETTEVRILFDDSAIYIGATLRDRTPAEIITTSNQRDASLADQDGFTVAFDTFRDGQNGFMFGTNSEGVQFDVQVRNEVPNVNWNGSWDVRTHRDGDGWTAEFRIPLRTLRYSPAPQSWGLQLYRYIHRRRERSYWAPLPRQFSLTRLSSAGELTGLDLRTPRNFQILPYVVGSADRSFAPGASTIRDGEWGIDAKVGVTSGLNLDVTYNTDFAQVEVDSQQINLTRFNLRFPEKRPFFLENSGLFTVGTSGGGLGSSGDLDLFFSRRIGLDDDGGLVPIRGGGRLSGKAAGYNVGLLNMQTDDVGSKAADNFTVARVSRDLPSRSSVGAMFVNRTATGTLAGPENWNRTWGLDGRVGVGERVTVDAFAARTETPGLTGREAAWNVASRYDDGSTAINFDYGITGEDFNPEVGYLENTLGYRRWYVRAAETMRQERIRRWGFREFQPHVTYTRYDYLDDGGLLNAELHVDNHWDWENGNFISTAVNGTWEGLKESFEIYPGIVVPPGDHGGLRLTTRANTDRRRWIFGRHQWDVGRFLTGNQQSHVFETVLRKGGTFLADLTWTNRHIDLPQGGFTTNLGNMRVTYNFTPSVFVQSLVQYNDRTDRWSTNLRFHWLATAGTGLFVVYNDTESLGGLGPVNRAFIVKYVRQISLLR